MSEDRLLRSEGTDPLERALLRAGAEERPSKEARAATLAALGIARWRSRCRRRRQSTAATPRLDAQQSLVS